MKNRKLIVLIGITIIISMCSVIMAKTIQQLVFTFVGILIMMALSYLNPQFLLRYAEIFSLFIFFIGSIVGYNNRLETRSSYLLNCGELKIRMYTFMLLNLPFLGIWLYKKIKQHGTDFWVLKFLSIFTIEMVCVRLILRSEKIKIWLMSLVGKTESEYIYNILKRAQLNYRIWDESVFFEDILYYLPEAEDTLLLTYYISQYGIVIGCCTFIALIILFIKIFNDFTECKFQEAVVGNLCVAVLFSLMILNVLVNFRLLPFLSHRTFLPFFTQNFGENIYSYILMGIILSVYRYNLNGKRENSTMIAEN